MSELSAGRIQLRWRGVGVAGLLLSGCEGAEGQLFAEGRPRLENDVRFESGIEGCHMQPRSVIICREANAGCAP